MAEREGYIPMLLRGAAVRALVVGYGPVGRRKAGKILAGGGSVVAVDPAAEPLAAERLAVRRKGYGPADLAGITHVFACTADPALNARVAEDAAAAGLPANSSTDPATCAFVLPASTARRNFSLLFSGAGRNPSAAMFLKRLAERSFDLEAIERHIDRMDAARASGDREELDRLAGSFDPKEFMCG